MQAALKVAEQHRDGLDALLVCKVLDPVFLNLVRRDAVLALLFRFQVQLFKFVVRQRQKITQFGGHESPRKDLASRSEVCMQADDMEACGKRGSRAQAQRQSKEVMRKIQEIHTMRALRITKPDCSPDFMA